MSGGPGAGGTAATAAGRAAAAVAQIGARGDGAGVAVYTADADRVRPEIVARYGALVAEVRSIG
ncbi:hypothetical protein OH807_24265 [Kitasatospora sp. NBC_01560]|uniref:hypothetical protein n=1 Tax=Kitasatospora sp. NBC_01560 TaxID=2975965 RepID=UPI00387096C1